jgi:hypothetical protein
MLCRQNTFTTENTESTEILKSFFVVSVVKLRD